MRSIVTCVLSLSVSVPVGFISWSTGAMNVRCRKGSLSCHAFRSHVPLLAINRPLVYQIDHFDSWTAMGLELLWSCTLTDQPLILNGGTDIHLYSDAEF